MQIGNQKDRLPFYYIIILFRLSSFLGEGHRPRLLHTNLEKKEENLEHYRNTMIDIKCATIVIFFFCIRKGFILFLRSNLFRACPRGGGVGVFNILHSRVFLRVRYISTAKPWKSRSYIIQVYFMNLEWLYEIWKQVG